MHKFALLLEAIDMKINIRKTLQYILSAGLAFLLLWVSFREVEWKDFVEMLGSCRWGFVLLSMAAGALAFWLRAVRWRQLLLPIDDTIGYLTTFNGVNIGNLSNFIFPRIGELVRCGVVTRHSVPLDPDRPEQRKASYDKVLGTVVLERGWELLVMLMLLAVVVAAGFGRFGSFFVEQIWLPMSGRFSFSMWWVVVPVISAAAAGCYAIWHFRDRNTFCGRLTGIFRNILQGFSSCLKMDRKWLFFTYTALIWGMYWLMAASTVKAAPFLEGLDMIDALFLSLVGGLGFAVPVPGGIGAFHFIISLALSALYGIPVELGVVYATLSHTSQAITQIAFGAGSYISETFRK